MFVCVYVHLCFSVFAQRTFGLLDTLRHLQFLASGANDTAVGCCWFFVVCCFIHFLCSASWGDGHLWRGDWEGWLMLCHCAARRAERSVYSVCRRPHELLTSSSLPQVSVNVLAQLKLSAWRSHFGRQPNKWEGKQECGGSDGGGRWTQPVALSRARHICWPRGQGQSHS